MAKRIRSQGIKAHRQYTYEQAADVLGLSIPTVRRWRHEGLDVMDSQVPHLIVGAVLKSYVDGRNSKPRPALPLDKLLCMTCRDHKGAYGGLADYWPNTDKTGFLKVLCEDCGGPCCKLVSKAKLPVLRKMLTIVIRDKGET